MSGITQKLLMDFKITQQEWAGMELVGGEGIIRIISSSLFQSSCEHKLSRYAMNDLFHSAKYLDFSN